MNANLIFSHFLSSISTLRDNNSVEDESPDEVHEDLVVKRNAYQTGYGGYHNLPGGSSSSGSSSSSSSNTGYGYGGSMSQSSSYSSSSSYGGTGYGADPTHGTGYAPSGYSGYHQSGVQLAPFDAGPSYGRATLPPQSYRNTNYGRVTMPPTRSSACTTKPQSILNASTRCTVGANSCTVQCMNGYQFPNGQTKARMTCTNEEWILENLEWSNKLACERM